MWREHGTNGVAAFASSRVARAFSFRLGAWLGGSLLERPTSDHHAVVTTVFSLPPIAVTDAERRGCPLLLPISLALSSSLCPFPTQCWFTSSHLKGEFVCLAPL